MKSRCPILKRHGCLHWCFKQCTVQHSDSLCASMEQDITITLKLPNGMWACTCRVAHGSSYVHINGVLASESWQPTRLGVNRFFSWHIPRHDFWLKRWMRTGHYSFNVLGSVDSDFTLICVWLIMNMSTCFCIYILSWPQLCHMWHELYV